MRAIYVLYDSRCGVCSRLRAWMLEQPAYLTIDFVPAGSGRARSLFPELRHDEQPSELVVVTDEGEVYLDDRAWIVCFYALVEYRSLSFRLAGPPLRRLARAAWEIVSKNRLALSRVLALRSDADVAAQLESQPATGCPVEWEGADRSSLRLWD